MCALCDSEIFFTWREFRFGRLCQHRDMHIPVQVCLHGIVVVIAKLLLLWNNQQKSCVSSTLIILTTTSPQLVSILTLHLLTHACHICCAQLAFHFLSPHNASEEVPFYKFSFLDFTEPAQSFSRTVLPNLFSFFFFFNDVYCAYLFKTVFSLLNFFFFQCWFVITVTNQTGAKHFDVQCSPLLKGTHESWKWTCLCRSWLWSRRLAQGVAGFFMQWISIGIVFWPDHFWWYHWAD